jgi:hypothetical protein
MSNGFVRLSCSFLASLMLVAACAADRVVVDGEPDPEVEARDLAEQLAATRGVSSVRELTDTDDQAAGTRRFLLAFGQMVDVEAPVVVQVSEAAVALEPTSEIADLLDANLLVVERRFQGKSQPEPRDWTLLGVEAVSHDLHAVIRSMSDLYDGSWIGTGGVEILHHARRHAVDLDGVIAVDAPVYAELGDARVEQRLGELAATGCGLELRAVQRRLLGLADLAVPILDETGAYQHAGAVRAFETAVIELELAFWQRYDADSCLGLPAAHWTDKAVLDYLDRVSPPSRWSDLALAQRGHAFTWQEETELGRPMIRAAHLRDLLTLDHDDHTPYLPHDVQATYDRSASVELIRWLGRDARRVITVHAAVDPTSAAAPALAPSNLAVIAGGARPSLGNLAPGDLAEVESRLWMWAGRID